MNTDTAASKKSPWAVGSPYLVLLVICLVAPLIFHTMFWQDIFILVLCRLIVSVAFRTINLSGDLSLAMAGFMGLGGYACAILAKWLGWPPYLAIPAGAVVAMIIGVVTSLPFARLRTMYYALVSLFLGMAFDYIFIAGGKLTGGADGLMQIPSAFHTEIGSYYFILALAVVSCIAMYRFEFSRIGYTLKALAQSHTVAASIGVNELFYRALAVGFGCFFAGLAGAAYALYNTVLSPNDYTALMALFFFTYAVVGGMNRFIGPMIGTIVLVIIPEYFRSWNVYAPFATAIALILVAYFLPGGLASIPHAIRKAVDKYRQAAADKSLGGGGSNAA